MKFFKSDIKKARIEIIPMIDTIFFLLVYFMFQTLVMVKMSPMNVNIPKPSPPSNAKPPPRLAVKVDAQGNYFVGAELVNGDPDSIANRIDADVAKNPNTLVIVNIDPEAKVQALITCLDGVNEASQPDGSAVNMVINGQGGTNIPV